MSVYSELCFFTYGYAATQTKLSSPVPKPEQIVNCERNDADDTMSAVFAICQSHSNARPNSSGSANPSFDNHELQEWGKHFLRKVNDEVEVDGAI